MIFRQGQYVTGVDRSYQRSIYQVIGFVKLPPDSKFIKDRHELGGYSSPVANDLVAMMRFIGFAGKAPAGSDISYLRIELVESRDKWKGLEQEFRHATGEELEEIGVYV